MIAHKNSHKNLTWLHRKILVGEQRFAKPNKEPLGHTDAFPGFVLESSAKPVHEERPSHLSGGWLVRIDTDFGAVKTIEGWLYYHRNNTPLEKLKELRKHLAEKLFPWLADSHKADLAWIGASLRKRYDLDSKDQ